MRRRVEEFKGMRAAVVLQTAYRGHVARHTGRDQAQIFRLVRRLQVPLRPFKRGIRAPHELSFRKIDVAYRSSHMLKRSIPLSRQHFGGIGSASECWCEPAFPAARTSRPVPVPIDGVPRPAEGARRGVAQHNGHARPPPKPPQRVRPTSLQPTGHSPGGLAAARRRWPLENVTQHYWVTGCAHLKRRSGELPMCASSQAESSSSRCCSLCWSHPWTRARQAGRRQRSPPGVEASRECAAQSPLCCSDGGQ